MTKIKVVTHNGKFHTDDVFGVAVLKCLYGDIEIIRTRDEEVLKNADIVLDVGSVYNKETKRFDHHQIGGAGVRPNNVPYASFGLVWKEYGAEICKDIKITEEIDQILVQPIDAGDNGIEISMPKIEGVFTYSVNSIVDLFRPTHTESDDYDSAFLRAVEWAHWVLMRQIQVIVDTKDAEALVQKAYENSQDKRLVVFGVENVFGREVTGALLMKYPEPLYAVLYRKDVDSWQLATVKKEEYSFATRKPLPESWAGKRDEELIQVTGVKDAIFCHNKRFMAVTKTKEGALKLAELALAA
jgi:uncharacterized UPF0160 family protein